MGYELPTTLYSGIIIALNGSDGPKYFRAGDSLMKPGMVCMQDAVQSEIKVCITTGVPFGIVGCDSDHDLSTVYTVGERVPVWLLGSGVELWVLSGDNTDIAFAKGQWAELADLTTYKGCIKSWAHTQVTTGAVAAKLTERVISDTFKIGISQMYIAEITSAIQRYVPLII